MTVLTVLIVLTVQTELAVLSFTLRLKILLVGAAWADMQFVKEEYFLGDSFFVLDFFFIFQFGFWRLASQVQIDLKLDPDQSSMYSI